MCCWAGNKLVDVRQTTASAQLLSTPTSPTSPHQHDLLESNAAGAHPSRPALPETSAIMSRSTVEAETQILSNFLLSNATFPDIIDLKTFRSLFPKNHQDSPQIKQIYNHLTLKRTDTLETVRKNIEFEAKMSHQLLKRERREADSQDRAGDAEMLEQADMNGVMQIYGDIPSSKNKILPIEEFIKCLEDANEKLETEMAILDDDCQKLTKEIKDIVGDLSSLKFGSFTGANEGLVDSVIEDLARLQDTCDQVLKPAD
ncbi:hypothetical protein H072_2283 [Dactylellina haptotyla CBS 200.50]|uniref:Uncharacterized protein n=1 Tax=Dactylellina haptotyla (strain CBS 200.50) TaxID=1284197 RepID=S8ALE7_DACHA|nr:hypothetical protein H072_2283 [Dactylellina haptotyla CBS 200.50]